MFLGLTSETMPLYELQDFADTKIAQRLSTVTGVAQVQVHGGQKYAVRVQADPELIDELVRASLSTTLGQRAVQATVETSRAFQPGLPTPVHRMA